MRIRVADIKRLTAQFYGISRSAIELGGGCRGRHGTIEAYLPRVVGMALCRRYTAASLAYIGAAFGDRDHSTVVNAAKRLPILCTTRRIHALDVALLCAQIEAGHISVTSNWAALYAFANLAPLQREPLRFDHAKHRLEAEWRRRMMPSVYRLSPPSAVTAALLPKPSSRAWPGPGPQPGPGHFSVAAE